MMTLAQAHALLPDSTLVGYAGTEIERVHTDTRTLQPGDLFVALKGERFDAHDFLEQARAAGAVAALVERAQGGRLGETAMPGLLVNDTLTALQSLATAWRARMQLPLIAVTGSNGKTTVTQMIASMLRMWLGDAAFWTQGNFNNHIGVPLTLLGLRQEAGAPDARWHRAGVVELGMNHPGEIAQLAAMTAPTVALVNNAQREHQEFMHSVQAVALENGAVIEALGSTGIAVFPADDAQAPLWYRLAGERPTLTFALQGAADVTADAAWATAAGGCNCARRTAARNAAARGRPSQREERACRYRLHARRGLPARCDRARARGLRAGEGPLADRRRCARGDATSRSSTTPTTRTPTRCARRSTCLPSCPGRAGSCSATWVKWATRGRPFIARSAHMRKRADSTRCGRQAA